MNWSFWPQLRAELSRHGVTRWIRRRYSRASSARRARNVRRLLALRCPRASETFQRNECIACRRCRRIGRAPTSRHHARGHAVIHASPSAGVGAMTWCYFLVLVQPDSHDCSCYDDWLKRRRGTVPAVRFMRRHEALKEHSPVGHVGGGCTLVRVQVLASVECECRCY